jgi:iron(III) transport system permease protein
MFINCIDWKREIILRNGLDKKNRFSFGSVGIWIALGLLIGAPVVSFLIIGFSPRAFHQGSQWFTFQYVSEALQGYAGKAIFNSLWVATLVSVLAVGIATSLAWVIHRTNIGGRKFWAVMMWLLLLLPTWMTTLGWTDLLQPSGVATALGFDTSFIYHEFFGPLGIVIVLTFSALPFAYFIISAGLQGLGPEFEDAARIHGANRIQTFQTILPIIAPALWSALAVSFAETISDFGVADTLGYHSHFPLATFVLFKAINSYPANFSVAAVIAAALILCTIPPIILQSRVMRKNTYAVLSGRTRAIRIREFGRGPKVAATSVVATIFSFAIGVPLIGAIVDSLINEEGFAPGSSVHFTLRYFKDIFHPPTVGQSLGTPLLFSNQLGIFVASITGFFAVIMARRLVKNSGGWSQKITDVFLLGSIAIPGVVLGIGYIFFYNLSFITHHVINIYETVPLLVIALVASSLPGQTRLIAGPVSQLQPSLSEAARVHGANRFEAWRTTNLPLMSRVLLWGWLLTFTKTISELAIATILYPPGRSPASVTIQEYLANYNPGAGTAMTVLTLFEMLTVIGVALGIFRVLVPRGWRRIGWSEVQS